MYVATVSPLPLTCPETPNRHTRHSITVRYGSLGITVSQPFRRYACRTLNSSEWLADLPTPLPKPPPLYLPAAPFSIFSICS